MRGAPHSGLASDIVRIKARTSAVTVGRPRRFRPCPDQAEKPPMPREDRVGVH